MGPVNGIPPDIFRKTSRLIAKWLRKHQAL
jgi:hypothetical protein